MFERIREAIHNASERHRNRPFLEASMAACAYVALADGDISLGERGRVDQILEQLERLSFFDPHEGVDLFNDYAEALRTDAEQGRARVMQALDAIRQDAEAADLIARMTVAISEASGAFSPGERQATVEVIAALGVEDLVPRNA